MSRSIHVEDLDGVFETAIQPVQPSVSSSGVKNKEHRTSEPLHRRLDYEGKPAAHDGPLCCMMLSTSKRCEHKPAISRRREKTHPTIASVYELDRTLSNRGDEAVRGGVLGAGRGVPYRVENRCSLGEYTLCWAACWV